ncbi:ATPase, T2SS/T4P/T4SS family [uncultured Sneathiella sp.]|jgi:pilus assembly protein CpaF|uniref:ATPase, T2SS/T4P/T4SS family n=1 Tax=uncultured Sneathiella sp. TaxID=879315 RepID=UPI0030EC147E|tara:strand:- start:22913 stop:24169 length:1257 start_codon:yes stop_codon:yes gene_type:complete
MENYTQVLLSRYEHLRKVIRSSRWGGNIASVNINGPHKLNVYVAGKGKITLPSKELGFLTQEYLRDLYRGLAAHYGVLFNDNMPILACKTPDGDRLLGITGPTVDETGVASSIRIKRKIAVTWEDYGLKPAEIDRVRETFVDGKTVLLCGGTNAGKTTVLNLAAKDIPKDDRVMTMEDTRELDFSHVDDRVHLVYSRYDSTIRITPADLIDAIVRMEPHHNWMSELSIRNALAALQVMDLGHSFSATTHANTLLDGLRGWRRRIAMAGGSETEMSSIMDMFADNVALMLQVKRVEANDKGIADQRLITDVRSAKQVLDKRSTRAELAGEPVFPRMPEPDEMRRMVKAMNGGRDLSEMQEESLKMMAMMVSMMRTGTANDDRIGDVPDHHLFSPEERMVIGSDQIAMPEAPSAPFREVS